MSVEQTNVLEPNEAPPSVESSKEAPQPSLEDYAANEYRNSLISFKTQVEHLSGAQAKKVLIALMEYPFEKNDHQWSYAESQRAFVTGTTIMDCRFVLMKAIIELTVDQKRAILNETKDDGVTLTPPKEGQE